MRERLERSATAAGVRWERLSATQRLMARGIAVTAAVLLLAAVVGGAADRAAASDQGLAYTGTATYSRYRLLRRSSDATGGELELLRLKVEHADALLAFSARYQVPADLAALIFDTALQEGLDPDLAFRLVKIESGFNRRAHSIAGAIGLAQVLLGTARLYQPGMTSEELFDPATNLRIGFRYLHDLLAIYGDTRLALLAYNRGPARLKQLLDQGQDPGNGYARSVMDGYAGVGQ